jgi:riboflavin biosynthesis pyrimidine reductase
MSELKPLTTLLDTSVGDEAPLPKELAALYGSLRLPRGVARPHVFANFVTSIDGVVSLQIPGKAGGGDISGGNEHDRIVMGLLRAVADAVITGAGTLRDARQHVWTPKHIYPKLAPAYDQLRVAMGKAAQPLNVIVTSSGALDVSVRIFQPGVVPVLVVTTSSGARLLRSAGLPDHVRIAEVAAERNISTAAVLDAVAKVQLCEQILLECGPALMASFVAERQVDELFLTIAPQVAGRDDSATLPSFVAGRRFAPDDARWGSFVSLKFVDDFLFVRYALERLPQTK